MIIIDLEWTCCRNGEFDQEKDGEIIEIGAVKIADDYSGQISTFQCFIKPIVNPELTEFAKKLLHIKQEEIDEAETFDVAWGSFLAWLDEDGFCSWGNDDLVRIKRECDLHDLEFPFVKHCNLHRLFRCGQRGMLKRHKLKWHGVRHRAINDAITYANIALAAKPEKVNYRTL